MNNAKRSQVRIIAGNWRGRKLSVPAVEGLRPTPDRVRETLFNWLTNECRDSNVLDCFAGSGVLGFEAASRGASRITMIEQNKKAYDNLQSQKQRLQADNMEIVNGDALALIAGLERRYDLVFVDPPYAKPVLRANVINSLIDNEKLNDGARIYLEWPQGEVFELPRSELSWWKQKKAGQVHYAIAEWRLSR